MITVSADPAIDLGSEAVAHAMLSSQSPLGHSDLFVLNDDGGGLRNLTTGLGLDACLDPVWAPDGTQLAFRAERPAGVFLIGIDGTRLRPLPLPPTAPPGLLLDAWLPDGRLLLRDAGADPWPTWATLVDFYTVAPDGRGFRHEGSTEAHAGRTLNARGKLYPIPDAGDRLFFADADGSNERPLLDRGRPLVHASWATPAWAPDGQWVAFVADEGDDQTLYVADADGTDVRRVGPIAFEAPFHWAPDGRHLAYVGDAHGVTALYVAAVDGSVPQPLADLDSGSVDEALHADLAWSPLGEDIAFASMDEGALHLYRVDIAEGRLQRLTSDTEAFEVVYGIAWGP